MRTRKKREDQIVRSTGLGWNSALWPAESSSTCPYPGGLGRPGLSRQLTEAPEHPDHRGARRAVLTCRHTPRCKWLPGSAPPTAACQPYAGPTQAESGAHAPAAGTGPVWVLKGSLWLLSLWRINCVTQRQNEAGDQRGGCYNNPDK